MKAPPRLSPDLDAYHRYQEDAQMSVEPELFFGDGFDAPYGNAAFAADHVDRSDGFDRHASPVCGPDERRDDGSMSGIGAFLYDTLTWPLGISDANAPGPDDCVNEAVSDAAFATRVGSMVVGGKLGNAVGGALGEAGGAIGGSWLMRQLVKRGAAGLVKSGAKEIED